MNTLIVSGSPLTIENIFCHAFSVTLEIIRRLSPYYMAVIAASLLLSQSSGGLGLATPLLASIVIAGASCLLILVTTYAAARIWQGQPIASTGELFRQIDLMLIFECAWLFLRVCITSIPLLLLLIIPGLVYIFNRSLAFYCLILRRTTVSEALTESRELMTCEPWYATNGPQLRLGGLYFILLLCSVGIGIISLTGSSIHVVASIWLTEDWTRILDWTGALVDLILRQFFAVFQIAAGVGFYIDMKNRTTIRSPTIAENR